MISFVIAGSIGLVAMQAGIDAPRRAFTDCLKNAATAASGQNIAVPDYGAFVLKTCAAQADSFKASLVGFDVKHGVKRAQATTDAQAQVDDYLASETERYEYKSKPKT